MFTLKDHINNFETSGHNLNNVAIVNAINTISTFQFNGKVKLPDDGNCILIGSTKLSRGQRIKNLTVSIITIGESKDKYFYDSAMQLARFLGPRKEYFPFIKVFLNKDLINVLKECSKAEKTIFDKVTDFNELGYLATHQKFNEFLESYGSQHSYTNLIAHELGQINSEIIIESSHSEIFSTINLDEKYEKFIKHLRDFRQAGFQKVDIHKFIEICTSLNNYVSNFVMRKNKKWPKSNFSHFLKIISDTSGNSGECCINWQNGLSQDEIEGLRLSIIANEIKVSDDEVPFNKTATSATPAIVDSSFQKEFYMSSYLETYIDQSKIVRSAWAFPLFKITVDMLSKTSFIEVLSEDLSNPYSCGCELFEKEADGSFSSKNNIFIMDIINSPDKYFFKLTKVNKFNINDDYEDYLHMLYEIGLDTVDEDSFAITFIYVELSKVIEEFRKISLFTKSSFSDYLDTRDKFLTEFYKVQVDEIKSYVQDLPEKINNKLNDLFYDKLTWLLEIKLIKIHRFDFVENSDKDLIVPLLRLSRKKLGDNLLKSQKLKVDDLD